MTHITHEPTIIIDDRKKRVVLVPLSLNRGFAKVDEEDFLALQAKGFTGGWYLNIQGTAEYVLVNDTATNNNKCAARLIMNPPPGYVVRYQNNDRKDLRRCNLILQSRKALKAENLEKAHG